MRGWVGHPFRSRFRRGARDERSIRRRRRSLARGASFYFSWRKLNTTRVSRRRPVLLALSGFPFPVRTRLVCYSAERCAPRAPARNPARAGERENLSAFASKVTASAEGGKDQRSARALRGPTLSLYNFFEARENLSPRCRRAGPVRRCRLGHL